MTEETHLQAARRYANVDAPLAAVLQILAHLEEVASQDRDYEHEEFELHIEQLRERIVVLEKFVFEKFASQPSAEPSVPSTDDYGSVPDLTGGVDSVEYLKAMRERRKPAVNLWTGQVLEPAASASQDLECGAIIYQDFDGALYCVLPPGHGGRHNHMAMPTAQDKACEHRHPQVLYTGTDGICEDCGVKLIMLPRWVEVRP